MQFDSLLAKDYSKDTKTLKTHLLPLYAGSAFEFESLEQSIDIFTGKEGGHVYSRYGNPTIDAVAAKLAEMETFDMDEDGYAIMTSSGMSAISTVMTGLLQAGDKVITQGDLYGGTTELLITMLGRMGIETVIAELHDLEATEAALQADPSIKMMYLETPANPTMRILDIQALSDLAKAHDVITTADNTFCTPYIQQPLKHGIDIVIHSTTKYLNGHSSGIGGIIISCDAELMKPINTSMKLMGTNASPFEAWLLNLGLKTLALRMERHCNNAELVAAFLSSHRSVSKVNYPGLESFEYRDLAQRYMRRNGGMLSFEVTGGLQGAINTIESLDMIPCVATLGDTDSIVLHPATSSHLRVDPEQRRAAGITDGLIRLSVGIESAQDIIADLERALNRI